MCDYDFHKELLLNKEMYLNKGLTGLVNLSGNHCFMNSVIQSLSNSLKLTDYFLSLKYKEDTRNTKKERNILNSYRVLLDNIWCENKIIKPVSFVKNICEYYPDYKQFQQEDAHECLLYILDALHKAISYPVNIKIHGQVKTDSEKLMEISLNTWTKFFEKEYSFIIKNFYGSKVNKI